MGIVWLFFLGHFPALVSGKSEADTAQLSGCRLIFISGSANRRQSHAVLTEGSAKTSWLCILHISRLQPWPEENAAALKIVWLRRRENTPALPSASLGFCLICFQGFRGQRAIKSHSYTTLQSAQLPLVVITVTCSV